MAKGEQKKLGNQITSDRNASNTTFGQVYNPMQQSRQTVANRADNERQGVWGGYSNAANTGYMNDDLAARIRAAGSGANGGAGGEAPEGGGGGAPQEVDPNKQFTGFGGSRALFDAFNKDGGVDMNKLEESLQYYRPIAERGFDGSRIQQDIDRLSSFGASGGINPEELAAWRAKGANFDEFARNGGYSDIDQRNFRQRATSPLASTYSNLAANMNRMNAVQGGYGPGFGRSQQAMARQGAQAMGAQALDAENTLQNNIREGRRWGTEGGVGMERDINTLLSQNRINASNLAAGQGTNLQDAIVRAKLGGAAGIESTNRGAQDLLQRGKITGAQGIFGIENALNQRDIAEANRAASSAAAGAAQSLAERRFAADQERWLAEFEAGNRLAGLGGMQNLYGSESGELSGLDNRLMNMYNSQAGVNQGYLGAQQNMANMPGVTDRIFQGIGAGSGLLTAIGGFGQGM